MHLWQVRRTTLQQQAADIGLQARCCGVAAPQGPKCNLPPFHSNTWAVQRLLRCLLAGRLKLASRS